MTETIKTEEMLKVIRNIADVIKENRDYLTMLDSEIGDGDHGINMNRGFLAVQHKLADFRDKDIGTILKNVGSTLFASAGGTGGPLYGTAFMKAGEVVEGKCEIDLNDLVKMFEAAEQGIVDIGNAELVEKTMLDALHPAVETLKESANRNSTLIEALGECANAAYRGMKNTRQMIAKKGRAMYLGERGRGHQDVGATSFYLILKSTVNTLEASRKRL